MGKVTLNPRGLEAAALKMGPAVAKAAEKVADNVRSQNHMVNGVPGDDELPVRVDVGESSNMRVNRAKAWVVLAHPAGLAVQAKNGALTKAASDAGLTVKGESNLVEYVTKAGVTRMATRAQVANWTRG